MGITLVDKRGHADIYGYCILALGNGDTWTFAPLNGRHSPSHILASGSPKVNFVISHSLPLRLGFFPLPSSILSRPMIINFPTPFFSHYLILHDTLSLSVLLYGSATTYSAVILITLTYSNISSFLFSLLCSKLTHSNFQVQEAVRILISAGETKVQSTQQKWNRYVPKGPSVRMISYASIAKPPKHRCGDAVLLVLRRCAMLVELGTGRR